MASSTKSRTAATDRLVLRAVFDAFAASISEIAAAVEGVSKDRARASLNRLEAHGLAAPTDVNDESQGSARRGKFKEAVWQSVPTHDDATWDELDAKLSAAYGLPLDDDAPEPEPKPADEPAADAETADEPKPKGKRRAAKPKPEKTPRQRVIPEGVSRSEARRLECPSCGLVARISPGAIAKIGRTPLCPCDDKTRLVQTGLAK